MADHAKPILTDNYTDVLSQIRGRFEDQAKGFDPANTTATNITTGTIRWNSAEKKFQKWSGTAWGDLTDNYVLSGATFSTGTANGVAYLNGSKVLTTGSALTFDGANLGIGTSSPGTRLDVVGTGRFNSMEIGANNSDINNTNLNPIAFKIQGTERMRLDTSGNLGLGVTPSAWSASAKAIQFGAYGAVYQNASGYPELAFNVFQNAGNNYIYRNTDVATRYSQTNGAHQWFTAPSGTAGNTISFTQAMTLDANGNLGIGTSSPSAYSGYKTLAIVGGGNGGVIDINPSGGVTSGGLQIVSTASATNLDFYGASGGSASYLAFRSGTYASVTERMRIDSNGKLILSAANQGIQFADGTTQTTAGINPATAAAGAIGTMAMLYNDSTSAITWGQVVAGTNLIPANAAGEGSGPYMGSGTTWRALGWCRGSGAGTTASSQRVTLFVRVS